MSDYSQFAKQTSPHGVMLHHFHGEGHPVGQGSMGPDQLAVMIEFLGGRRKILDAPIWMDKALSGKLEKGDLCLTFDDSLLCQKSLAVPVLKAFDISAFFFVYSSVFQGELGYIEIYRTFRMTCFDDVHAFYDKFFNKILESEYRDLYHTAISDFTPANYLIEFPFYSDNDRKFHFLRDRVLGPRAYQSLMDSMIAEVTSFEQLSKSLWMSDQDLTELSADGHVIGLHSYSHPTRLLNMPEEEQNQEYTKNLEHLDSVLESTPISMSHPSNSYDGTTLDTLTRLGVQLGFRSNMFSEMETSLEYPREDSANIRAMISGFDQ